MSDKPKVVIDYAEVSLHEVLQYFVDAYVPQGGGQITKFEPFLSPDGKRVAFKLWIESASCPAPLRTPE